MNRAARRAQMFLSGPDYDAFERVLEEAGDRIGMRLLAYAVMPTHWHLVVWPVRDHDLSRYMQWLTRTHAQRWHRAHGSVGTGAVYQGRYRAVAVQTDEHFLTACAYVERNPVRAGLVSRASDWPWCSAWDGPTPRKPILAAWPVTRPTDWVDRTSRAEPVAADDLRRCIRRSIPFGTAEWIRSAAARLALTGRVRGPGRPPRARRDRRN